MTNKVYLVSEDVLRQVLNSFTKCQQDLEEFGIAFTHEERSSLETLRAILDQLGVNPYDWERHDAEKTIDLGKYAGTYGGYLRDTERTSQPEAQGEPVAWESMTIGFIRYITDSKYRSFPAEIRKWYKPYHCSRCHNTIPTPCPECAKIHDALPDNLSESKDWLAGDLVERIEWLKGMLRDAQAEVDEQCRQNGMGSEREARLMARVDELEKECAKKDEELHEHGVTDWANVARINMDLTNELAAARKGA